MNGFLEGGIHDLDKTKAGIPLDEQWFTYKNGGGYPSGGEFYSYDKLAQVGRHGPGPSDMIVFTDENADTIDDGMFLQYVGSSAGAWENLPGSYHSRSDALSFADGHADIRRWMSGQHLLAATGKFSSGADQHRTHRKRTCRHELALYAHYSSASIMK